MILEMADSESEFLFLTQISDWDFLGIPLLILFYDDRSNLPEHMFTTPFLLNTKTIYIKIYRYANIYNLFILGTELNSSKVSCRESISKVSVICLFVKVK